MARDDDDYDDDDTPAQPAKPRARVTGLTLALIFLNLLAAAGFLVLMVLDYQVRQDWSYAAFRNVVAVWGLPLDADEDNYLAGSLANETRPRVRLGPEQLKKAFSERRGRGAPDFNPVEEPPLQRVVPAQLTADVKAKLFEGIGDPVGSLEEEINRLKGKVGADIEEKAKEAAEKYKGLADEPKRAKIEEILLPLAWSPELVEKLHALVENKQGPELDAFLNESIQRRLYADILAPLHLQRPGDLEDFKVEKAADQTYSLSDLRALLETRIEAAVKPAYTPEAHYGKLGEQAGAGPKRDAIDRRHAVATLLFTLAQARVPLTGERLYPNGLDRAQVVVGVYDLAMAAPEYTQAMHTLTDRVLAAIKADRQGYEAELNGEKVIAGGFAGRYTAEIDRLKQLVSDLKVAEGRLADLQQQRAGFQKVHDDRAAQLKVAVAKLAEARKETFRSAESTRVLQKQLHEALTDLADVEARIADLETQIERASGVTRRPAAKKGRNP